MIQARKDVATAKDPKPEEQVVANPISQQQRVVPVRTVHTLDQRRAAFVTNTLGTPTTVLLSESGEGGTVQYRRVSIGGQLQHVVTQVQGASSTESSITVNPRCPVSQQELIQLICTPVTTSNLQTVELQNSIVNAPQQFQTIGNVTNVNTSGQRIVAGTVIGQTAGQVSTNLPPRIVLNNTSDMLTMTRLSTQGTTTNPQPIMVLDSSSNVSPSSDVTKVHSYSLASAAVSLAPTNVMQKVVISTSGQALQVQGHKPIIPHTPPRIGVKRPMQSTSVNSSDVLSHLTNVNKLLFGLLPCEGKISSIPSSSKPAKRMKTEKTIVGSRELTRRRKVAEHLTRKIHLLKIKYYQQQTEYFFLKNGGNLVDYIMWRKKVPPALLEYLKTNRFEHQDDIKVISEILSQSTLQSILNPSLLSSGMLSDHSQSSKTVSSHTLSYRLSSIPSSPTQRSVNASPSSPASNKSRQLSAVHKQIVKHNSISSVYDSQIGSQEEIVERAKQEAYVMQRVGDLRKEGLWSLKRLPKVAEAPRIKAHYDYLLEEMVWLATDFAQERKWKKAAAKKCARMITKYFQEREIKAEKAEKEEQARLKKIASVMAREIKHFWNNIEKLVEYKQQTWLEEKRKKVLDVHLNFIVDQTEKYSSWLTQGMNNPASSKEHSCSEFEVSNSEDDDEETIEKAEKDITEVEQSEEIKLLQQESEMPLEDFLDTLPPEILSEHTSFDQSKSTNQDESMDVSIEKKTASDDDDFHGSDEEEEDDEQTLLEQEQKEGNIDHGEEIKDLEAENEMSIEQLREKYSAAYASDFEMDTSEQQSDNESYSCGESSEDEVSNVSEDKTEDSLLKSLASEDQIECSDGNPSKEISDIAATAESFQPKGNTLSTTKVCTKVPFLLKHQLREYQHIGLDWLNAMHEKKLNGILADEMGLGKTIQTISVLAHLACDKGVWGPHLIVVPTSVMLNWEMELKKWCPAFKILTYYGTPKERKQKRVGWTKPNAFHVCITSYKLVIQDHQSFRRKRWKYLILDEAQHIKNFKSQRWQMLLNFQTSHRLLLTGTPLQNNLMELWSLMHFLMPNVFQSHREFREWFVNPLTGMIEGNSDYNDSIIKRLHKILRPFLLRRLKSEVEKQLPKKYEHVIVCRLSKRQRYLYDDFMAQTKTKETLATGSFMSVINILMQLRKVCNHPNMFEERPTTSPFLMDGISFNTASLAYKAVEYDPFKHINLQALNFLLSDLELSLTAFAAHRVKKFQVPPKLIVEIDNLPEPPPPCPVVKMKVNFCNSQTSFNSSPATARVAPTAVRLPTPSVPRTAGPAVVQQPQRFMVIPGQAPQTPPVTRSNNPTATTQSEHQYTLQLLQPGAALASLAPLGGLTLQLQPGPAGGTGRVQCIQSLIGGFGRVVQTAAGAHFVITSVANSVNTEQTSPLTTAQPTVTTVHPSTTKIGSPSVATPLLSNFNRAQQNSLPASSLTNQTVHNRPVGRVAPLNCHPTTTTASSTVNQNHVQPPAKNPVVHSLTKPTQKLDVPANANKKNSLFYLDSLAVAKQDERKNCLRVLAQINNRRCAACPIYGKDLVDAVKIMDNLVHPKAGCPWSGKGYVNCLNAVSCRNNPKLYWEHTSTLSEIVKTPTERLEELINIITRFVFVIPAVTTPTIKLHISHPPPSLVNKERIVANHLQEKLAPACGFLHPILSNNRTQFPELRLIQYDCGKLQRLAQLLWDLKCDHHRVLIFTQMTRMLDILEQFLNYHGHTYLRLDGNTKVEQRQALMERFNADKRIFCFILSTRSGGIGVNLTGADTVIFYDSDWNPTMDAQAQDRCHRIGQTRDVHIYRLISERTIEENILKKANQKRILGDLAIEGGNFTTAFFKKNSINELFGMNVREENVVEDKSMKDLSEKPSDVVDTFSSTQLEQALGMAEDDSDMQAAQTASAEAVAELAEFDESIPLDNDSHDNEEKSPAEEEFEKLMEQLTPVEKYAVQFLESLQENVSLEQLKLAEEEMEAQKKDWELGHLKALKEEEERRSGICDEDSPLYYSREASNQVFFSVNGQEEMPIWAPPTPPTNENDIYIDHTSSFWYDPSFMHESRLPPVFIKKEAKRQKIDPVVSAVSTTRKQKVRKDDMVNIPRSLFDRPSAAILKMRREVKLQKVKGLMVGGLSKPLTTFTGLKQPGLVISKPPMEPHQDKPEWLVQEDWAILQVIQDIQGIPLNLTVLLPAHTPNWDLASEAIFTISKTYRSAKSCRARYENVIVPREEGRIFYDTNPKKQKKTKGIYKTKNNRPMKTSQLYIQDNNAAPSKVFIDHNKVQMECAAKRKVAERASFSQASKVPKLASVLGEAGINFEQILTPMQIAANRAERIARDKQTKQQNTAVVQSIPAVPVQAQVQPVVVAQSVPAEQQVTQRQVLQQAPVSVANATSLTTQQVIASLAQQQLHHQAAQLNKSNLQSSSVSCVSLAKSLANSIMVSSSTGTPSAGTLASLSKALGQVASISSQGTTQIAAALSNATCLRSQRATATATTTMSVQEMVAAAAAHVRASTTVVGSTSTPPPVVSVSNLASMQLAQQRLPTTTTASTSVGQLNSPVAIANQRGIAQLNQIQAIRQNALNRQREQHNLKQQQQQHLKRLQTVQQQQAVGAKQVAGQIQQRVAGQQVKQRPMTEVEVQLMKRQKQAQLSGVLGQQQQQVSATLVKTVSAAPSIAIPVSAVTMGGVNINVSVPTPQGKMGAVQAKTATTITNQQLRHFQIQQQLINQARKGNKIPTNLQLTKVAAGSKTAVQGSVQIVPGSQQQQVKGLPTTMTVQQIQQAMKQAMPQGNLPVVVTATPSLPGVQQQQGVGRGEIGVKQAQTTTLPSSPLTTSSSGGVQLKGGVMVGGQATLLQQVASGQAGQLTLAVRAQGSSQPQQLQIQVQQSGPQQVRMQQLAQGASISIAQPITVQQTQGSGILPSSSSLVQPTQVSIQQQTSQQRLQQLTQGASISIAQPVTVQQSAILSSPPLQQQPIQVSTDPTQIVMHGVATTSSLQAASTTAQVVQAAIQVARQHQQAQAAAAAQKASPYTMRLRNPPK